MGAILKVIKSSKESFQEVSCVVVCHNKKCRFFRLGRKLALNAGEEIFRIHTIEASCLDCAGPLVDIAKQSLAKEVLFEQKLLDDLKDAGGSKPTPLIHSDIRDTCVRLVRSGEIAVAEVYLVLSDAAKSSQAYHFSFLPREP